MIDALHQLFGWQGEAISWWQMSLRALFLFCYGLILLRAGARRMLAGGTPFDILIMIVLGSSLSRALTGNAPIIPVMSASAALVAFHWVLSAVTFRFPVLGTIAKGKAQTLINNGRIDAGALRDGLISRADLEESLRSKGIGDAAEVQSAFIERNGRISVITSA